LTVGLSCPDVRRYLRETLALYVGDVAGRCCPGGLGRSPPRPTVSVLVREGDDGEARVTKVMTPAHRQAARHCDGDGVGYSMMSTTQRVGSMVPKPQTRIVRLHGTPRRLGPRIE
jgi:hypothetical protein